MNYIGTKALGKVILNADTPRRSPRFEHFLIPYYQRGYRWEGMHVRALLEDIDNFIHSGEENYCLQPIVVTPGTDSDGHNVWEVIDGQQRLITLHIIFSHIEKAKYSIFFENRNKSTAFLANLSADCYNHDDPDFHFMSNAHKIVAQWFDEKTEHDVAYIDDFYSKITKGAQVIWYELLGLGEDDKINTFNRFNVGKIPLTNAELIRALLLSKIKLGLNEREAIMRQGELSNEWNAIEHELQKEEIWFFLNNSTKIDYSSRIEYVFNLISNKEQSEYSIYLWFENQIKEAGKDSEAQRANQLWDEVKSLFAKFKSWYSKKELYHYVGFLLADHYPIEEIIKNSDTAKPVFKKWLIDRIIERMEKVDLNELSYHKGDLEKIFLLFNILTVNNLDGADHHRFPFNHYKHVKQNDGGWSIEHIHAQQSEPISEDKAIRTWLSETLLAISGIEKVEADVKVINENGEDTLKKETYDIAGLYLQRIRAMLQAKYVDQNDFNLLKDELIRVFDSASVHELDNLALLSKKDNSALNNAIFPVKRNRILELERSGKFIPPCTRNVFLKFYSNADTQPYYWSATDKSAYLQSMASVLGPFLTAKKKKSEQ